MAKRKPITFTPNSRKNGGSGPQTYVDSNKKQKFGVNPERPADEGNHEAADRNAFIQETKSNIDKAQNKANAATTGLLYPEKVKKKGQKGQSTRKTGTAKAETKLAETVPVPTVAVYEKVKAKPKKAKKPKKRPTKPTQRKNRGVKQTRHPNTIANNKNSGIKYGRRRTTRPDGERSRRNQNRTPTSGIGRATKTNESLVILNGETIHLFEDEIKRVRKIAASKVWGKNLVRKIGHLVSDRVQMNFNEQRDSTGKEWPALAEATIKKRMSRGPQHRDMGLKKDLDKFTGANRLRKKKGETKYQLEQRRASHVESTAPDLAEKRRQSFSEDILKSRPTVKMGDGEDTPINLLPLIDSGNLLASLTVGVSGDPDSDGEYSTHSRSTPRRLGNAPMFKINAKGDLIITPKNLSKKNKLKMGVHNRPVGQGGREFFFLKKADLDFISEVLTAWVLASGDESDVAKRTTGAKGGKGRLSTVKLGNTHGQQSERMGIRGSSAESLQNGLLNMVDSNITQRLNSGGVMDMINGARSIQTSTNRRINKMRREMGISV